MLNGEKIKSARMPSLKCFLITNIEFNKNDTCGLETYLWTFLTLDSYHLKLQPNYKKVFKGILICCKLETVFKSQSKL